MNRIGSARSYIGSRQGPQTATEEQLYNQAAALAREINAESKSFLRKNGLHL